LAGVAWTVRMGPAVWPEPLRAPSGALVGVEFSFPPPPGGFVPRPVFRPHAGLETGMSERAGDSLRP